MVYSLRMFGMSLVMMPITTNGLNSLPRRLNPHGTATNNTIQQIAGSIGTAILIAVMNARTTSVGEDLAKDAAANATGQMTEAQMLELKTQITQQALLEGIEFAFFVATIISLVALILSFFLKRAVNPEQPQMK